MHVMRELGIMPWLEGLGIMPWLEGFERYSVRQVIE